MRTIACCYGLSLSVSQLGSVEPGKKEIMATVLKSVLVESAALVSVSQERETTVNFKRGGKSAASMKIANVALSATEVLPYLRSNAKSHFTLRIPAQKVENGIETTRSFKGMSGADLAAWVESEGFDVNVK